MVLGWWITGVAWAGWLGVAYDQLRDPSTPGVPLEFVFSGSPAAAAGVQAGDVIVRVADQVVDHGSDVTGIVSSLPAGTEVAVAIQRPRGGGKAREIEVTLTLGSDEDRFAASQASCAGGDPMGCLDLGNGLRDGRGTPRDLPRALEIYRKTCSAGGAESCVSLAYMLENGQGTATDLGEAARMYQLACDAGNTTGCNNLGTFFGKGWGVSKDPAQAVKHYHLACEGSHALACRNLGIAFRRGHGVPVDSARADELMGRACVYGDADACNEMGARYANGEGVPRDAARAEEAYRKGCELGSLPCCANHALKLMDQGQLDQALAQARAACDGGERWGCYSLGQVQQKRGDAVAAAAAHRSACDGGEGRACRQLSTLVADPIEATDLVARGCTLGDGKACALVDAAGNAMTGRGVPLDPARAAALYRIACDGGQQAACDALSSIVAAAPAGASQVRVPAGRVAVLELSGELTAQERGVLADEVRGRVVRLVPSGVAVMSRENMEVMLTDMGIDAGCVAEGACEVETARNLGVDYVLSGSVTSFGGQLVLSLKLHDVKSGSLLSQRMARAATAIDLLTEHLPVAVEELLVVAAP